MERGDPGARDRAAAAGAQVPRHGPALAAIADLCTRLDGLPLAIEIAAARGVARSPEELLADVAGRMDELADDRRAVDRHRSLEAAVGWSYDLLAAREQRMLRELSVFAGGWTAPAAAAAPAVSCQCAPASSNGWALAFVRLNKCTEWPAFSRWPAMLRPMTPVPMNAIECLDMKRESEKEWERCQTKTGFVLAVN